MDQSIKKIIQQAQQDEPKIEEDLRKLKSDDEVNKEIVRIRAQRANFVAKVLEREEALIEKLQNEMAKPFTMEEKKRIEELANLFNAQVHTAYDNVVMDMLNEYQRLQNRWTMVTNRPGVKFVEGKVLPETISYIFGDVVEETPGRVTLNNVASITYGQETVRSISPVSDTEAWTYSYGANQIDLINTNGEVITKRNLTSFCETFIVMENKDIIFSQFGDKMIYGISSSDVIRDVTSTAPLHPNGISRSRDGGMLVCLSDCDVLQITPDSRGEVLHTDLAGNVTRRYDYHDDKIKLFTLAYRVAENVNLDICVIDMIDKTWNGVVVVMSVKGKVKCTYKGHPSYNEDFKPDDVCCDNQGRILVTDFLNHAIHLLSPEGAFLQLLLTEQCTLGDSISSSIALRNNTLWVGCHDGEVKVYKYRDLNR